VSSGLRLPAGRRAKWVLRAVWLLAVVGAGAGLAVAGGVITSAGIVPAGTFSVLALLPLVLPAEIGSIIAFGVLLDTFLARPVLVPALVLDAGARIRLPPTIARAES
jgi:RND superfamily putative drug exporter